MKIENIKPNIILFGPPGVGKSTVGGAFRDEFGFDFYDGDNEMTPQERELVSKGQWGDLERHKLLIRMGETVKNLHQNSEIGLATSVALTRQWMREFLNEKSGGNLRFVLVTTKLGTAELESLISKRREEGHAITIESFRKFTAAFETPTMPHLVLHNPQDSAKRNELISNIRQVINLLSK